MGVAMKANMLVVFVQLGIAMGIQPLVGYNFGAGNFRRMKDAMKFALLCNLIAGFLITIIYFIFSLEIIRIFINDEEVIEMVVIMLRALMMSTPVLGIQFVLNFSFQAMGKAKQSLALAVSRQGFIFFPATIILNMIFGLKGLVYAQPIADCVSILLAIAMFLYMNRDFKKMESALSEA